MVIFNWENDKDIVRLAMKIFSVVFALLPVSILAADYFQCPPECSCTDMVTKHAPHNWRMMMSERRLHRLMFGPARRYFSRQMTQSKAKSGRQMTCLGLLSMPSYIPSDIKKLCIYGDPESAKRPSTPPTDIFEYQQDSAGGFSHRYRSLEPLPARQLTTIDRSKFTLARDMTQLSMEGNRIKTVHPLDFEMLHNLKTLSLKNNRLKKISYKSFHGLDNLEDMDLSDNHLRRVSKPIFIDTPKLKQLKLKKNRLIKLSEKVFSTLKYLEVLDLSDNKLTFLPDGIFDRLHDLNELKLENNLITDIKPRLLYYLSGLTKLSIKGNKLKKLPADIFRPLIYLKYLDLSNNELLSVSAGIFNSQINLYNLDLSGNKIQEIEDGSFQNTSSLHTLSLSENKLERIRYGMWMGLQNLQFLMLAHNKISHLNNDAIKIMHQLQGIDFSHNLINRVPTKTFAGFLDLREIKLNNNQIKNVDDEAFGVSLVNNLSKVTWIYLQYNSLRTIKSRAFYALPWLKFLNLCHNKIRYINEKSFSYTSNLNALVLNNNEMPSIEIGTFRKLNRLKLLNMAYNKLSDLSFNAFLGLEVVEELNLEFNQIYEMSFESFLDTPNVRRINLKGNQLQTVDLRSFESMVKLRHLDFGKNEISRVILPNVYQGLLKYVSFADNKLFILSKNITNAVAFGGVLHLHGNPWLCDCQLSWLPKLAKQRYIEVPQQNEITCKQPEKLIGKKVTKLPPDQMQCLSEDFYQKLHLMMEKPYMRHVCNIAPYQVANLTAFRPTLPRKTLAHWHVTMVKNQNGEAMCNGVFVDQNWVLTTATCWQHHFGSSSTEDDDLAVDNHSASIILGEVYPKLSHQLPWKLRKPELIVLHPNYTSPDNKYDLAMVKLKALEPGVRPLVTRFPCILDETLLKNVIHRRRRGRVSARSQTETQIKVHSKSTKLTKNKFCGDLLCARIHKLTENYNADGSPLYFDLGEAGWVLAGIKNTAVGEQLGTSSLHQFIPLGERVSWINVVMSGNKRSRS